MTVKTKRDTQKGKKKWDVKTIIGSYSEKYNQNIGIYDLVLINQTQQTVFNTFPNSEKRVENTARSGVFDELRGV